MEKGLDIVLILIVLQALLSLTDSQSISYDLHEAVDVLNLQKIETQLLEKLSSYVKKSEEMLSTLQKLVNQADRTRSLVKGNSVEWVAGNPVDMFLMIRRFSGPWRTLDNLMRAENKRAGDILGTLQKFYTEDGIQSTHVQYTADQQNCTTERNAVKANDTCLEQC